MTNDNRRAYLISRNREPVAIVMATSQSQAINHIVRGEYNARAASTKDLLKFLPTMVVQEARAENESATKATP